MWRWRAGCRVSTTRRGGVDRRTATLIFAGRDRQVCDAQDGAPDGSVALMVGVGAETLTG
jgi:hypothetical protein